MSIEFYNCFSLVLALFVSGGCPFACLLKPWRRERKRGWKGRKARGREEKKREGRERTHITDPLLIVRVDDVLRSAVKGVEDVFVGVGVVAGHVFPVVSFSFFSSSFFPLWFLSR